MRQNTTKKPATMVNHPCAQPGKVHKGDCFQTEASALKPLLPYLKAAGVRTVWECAAGQENLVRGLKTAGFEVVASDVQTGQNFLTWQPEQTWDLALTNPPYTLKDAFFERCYALGKPFALFVPLTCLEGQKRQSLYRQHGLQVLVPWKRPDFTTPNGKTGGSYFMAAWFTWGLELPLDLVFVGKERDPRQPGLFGAQLEREGDWG